MTLTGINVFPLWSHNVSTITPNRNTKSLRKSCIFWRLAIKLSEFLRFRNLCVLQIKVYKKELSRKGLIGGNSLWVGWCRKNHWSSQSQKRKGTHGENVIYGLGHLGRIRYWQRHHMLKSEFSRSGRGRMRSRHPKQLCFWRSLFLKCMTFWS